MAIYEMRTYQAIVGKMGEIVELYKTLGYPAIERHPKKLVGYFIGDIGALHQLIHIWKFEDDADRRKFASLAEATPVTLRCLLNFKVFLS